MCLSSLISRTKTLIRHLRSCVQVRVPFLYFFPIAKIIRERPLVIQGGAEMGANLSEDEVQRALDFCVNLFSPTTPEQHVSVRAKLRSLQSEGSQTPVTPPRPHLTRPILPHRAYTAGGPHNHLVSLASITGLGVSEDQEEEVQDEDATRLRWRVYAGGRLEIFSKEKQLNFQLRTAFDDGLSHPSFHYLHARHC